MHCFDGHSLLSKPILSSVNDTESTLAYLLFEEVLVFDISVTCLEKKALLNNYVLV